MNHYRMLQPWTFRAGLLSLTPAQAEPRLYALQAVAPGVFSPWPSVQFKAGEVVGYDGPMDRATASAMTPVEPETHAEPSEPVPAPQPAQTPDPTPRKRGRPRKS